MTISFVVQVPRRRNSGCSGGGGVNATPLFVCGDALADQNCSSLLRKIGSLEQYIVRLIPTMQTNERRHATQRFSKVIEALLSFDVI